jgi:hypothetical protein
MLGLSGSLPLLSLNKSQERKMSISSKAKDVLSKKGGKSKKKEELKELLIILRIPELNLKSIILNKKPSTVLVTFEDRLIDMRTVGKDATRIKLAPRL